MSETKLAADARTEFGKGAARRIRRAGQIPAVLYGHGTAPVHVSLPGHQTYARAQALQRAVRDRRGRHDASSRIAKDVQRDPIARGDRARRPARASTAARRSPSTCRSTSTGESAPGTIHVVEHQQLAVEADATNLPEFIEVSVEGLDGRHPGHRRRAHPAGDATLSTAPDTVVVSVTEPRGSAEDEAADAEVAADQAAASAAAAGADAS